MVLIEFFSPALKWFVSLQNTELFKISASFLQESFIVEDSRIHPANLSK